MPRRGRRPTAYGAFSHIEQKFIKLYSVEELALIKSLTVEKLEEIVSETSANIMRAKKELEDHPEYQRAQEILKPLREGYNDAVKWQDTKRKVVLQMLHKHGKVNIGEWEEDEL